MATYPATYSRAQARHGGVLRTSAIALVFAALALYFVLGRGPASLVWLTGEAPSWLPFAGSGFSWMPFVGGGGERGAGPPPAALATSPSPSSSPAPSPASSPASTPSPSPAPSPQPVIVVPEPTPVTAAPPLPAPAPTPTPAPVPTPTPTPSPLAATESATPGDGAAPLAVGFTASASGGAGGYSFLWDFGDGSAQSTAQDPAHTYSTAGTYVARVLARDATGATATAQATITVRPAVTVAAGATPATGAAPLAVSFTSSASGGDGGPFTYRWDFGDGAGRGTGATSSYTYAGGGAFTATVTATDAHGDSGSACVTVSPLSVGLSASPGGGYFPFGTTLTARPSGGTGTYTTYAWAFGDGTTASGASASTPHTYASPGTYVATVTVTDSGSVSAISAGLSLAVTIPPLRVSATATPTSGLAPLAVSLGGSASGGVGPYNYGWDFGDGSSPTGAQPSASASHTYSVPGTFTATLTVTDSESPAATSTAAVTIKSKPPVPTIDGVSPAFGPETGGSAVTITGTYFENASAVSFGSSTASFSAPVCDGLGSCTIVATSPAAPAGTVSITVTTPGGTTPAVNDQFTYDLAWSASAAAGPAAREGASMVNDGAEVVLFGGSNGLTDLADTWTWNGSAWSSAGTPLLLTARTNAAGAYDVSHGAVVLFGGSCTLLNLLQCDLNDTWTWTAGSRTWTQAQADTGLPGSNQPSRREGAMMAYDGSRGQVILFGGYDGSGYLNDTWVFSFSGKSWTRLNSSSCSSGSLPGCRAFGAIGRDSSGQVVLFGGTGSTGYLGDTWTWNGSGWSSYALSGPSARSLAAMAYFNKPGGGTATGLMLFGGMAAASPTCPGGVCGDTWTWTGGRWQNLYATASAGSPAARYDASAATDTGGGVLLFGGDGGSAELSDTHLLK